MSPKSQVCLPVGSHGPRAPFAYACDHLAYVQVAMLAMLSTSSRLGDFVHLVGLVTPFPMLLHSRVFPSPGARYLFGPPSLRVACVGKRSPFRICNYASK